MSDPTLPPPEGLPDPAAGGVPPVPPPPPMTPPAGAPPPMPPPAYSPPPPGGHAAAAPSSDPNGPFSIGNAVNYGWAKFSQNAVPWVLALLTYGAAFVVLSIIWLIIFFGAVNRSSDFNCVSTQNGVVCSGGSSLGFFATLALTALGVLIFVFIAYLIQANLIRNALAVARGGTVDYASFFNFTRFGPIVIASLIVAVATGIGYLLCYIPGLIVSFLTAYTLFFLIDKNLEPIDAIKASFEFVKDNIGPLLLLWLVCALILIVGAIICYVGLLVAVPVVLLAQGFAYLRLQDQPVAA